MTFLLFPTIAHGNLTGSVSCESISLSLRNSFFGRQESADANILHVWLSLNVHDGRALGTRILLLILRDPLCSLAQEAINSYLASGISLGAVQGSSTPKRLKTLMVLHGMRMRRADAGHCESGCERGLRDGAGELDVLAVAQQHTGPDQRWQLSKCV